MLREIVNTCTKRSILRSLFILFLSISSYLYAESGPFEYLNSLDPQDESVKSLRRDVRNTIIAIKKGEGAETLPELKFYKYRINRDDNFWKIL